jgi:hypothetical protein
MMATARHPLITGSLMEFRRLDVPWSVLAGSVESGNNRFGMSVFPSMKARNRALRLLVISFSRAEGRT